MSQEINNSTAPSPSASIAFTADIIPSAPPSSSVSQGIQRQLLTGSPTPTPNPSAIAIPSAPMQMIAPRENDVLFGRGNGAGLHKGNVYFRHIIERYAPEYEKTTNNMSKNRIAGLVRMEIEELRPAGRFLQAKNKAYYLTTHEKTILEKIKQALRDRLKVNRNSQTPGDEDDSFRKSATESQKELFLQLMKSGFSHDESDDEDPPRRGAGAGLTRQSSFMVSKRTLDCLNNVFSSREDVDMAFTPTYQHPPTVGNGRSMTHRAQRMLLKNSMDTAATEPLSTGTLDLDHSVQHMDVSMNDLSFEKMSSRRMVTMNTSMDMDMGDVMRTFQLDDVFPKQSHLLPDVVIDQEELHPQQTFMVDSLFSLEQMTSIRHIEI